MALIKITSFAKAKNNGYGGGGSSSTTKGFTTSIKRDLETHTLWGQPFNGTQDVNGDMEVDGSINVSGNINVGHGIFSSSIETGTILSKTKSALRIFSGLIWCFSRPSFIL